MKFTLTETRTNGGHFANDISKHFLKMDFEFLFKIPGIFIFQLTIMGLDIGLSLRRIR